MPRCSHALMLSRSHALLLSCCHALRLPCSDAFMMSYSHALTLSCSNALRISCSHVLMLSCSHGRTLPCTDPAGKTTKRFASHALTLSCYHALTLQISSGVLKPNVLRRRRFETNCSDQKMMDLTKQVGNRSSQLSNTNLPYRQPATATTTTLRSHFGSKGQRPTTILPMSLPSPLAAAARNGVPRQPQQPR